MDGNGQPLSGIPIRSVSRAIRILQIINRLSNPTIMEITKESRLPYPTVFRIIMTLVHEGLIECEPSRKRYRPSELVWSLVTGFQQDDLLAARSREHLIRLTAEVHWPVTLSVRVGERMIIKDSTHTLTTQTFNNYYPGYTLPILDSAAGRCFVAFCPDEERQMILNSVAESGGEDERWSLRIVGDPAFLETIRTRGFATHARIPRGGGHERTAAVAVPVLGDDGLMACLALVYFCNAMGMEEAAAKYVPELQETSRRISAALSRTDSGENGEALTGWAQPSA